MIALVLSLACAPAAHAAMGDVDAAFGIGGAVQEGGLFPAMGGCCWGQAYDEATHGSIVQDSRGRTLVAGLVQSEPSAAQAIAGEQFNHRVIRVSRFLHNGLPDRSFGVLGSQTIAVGWAEYGGTLTVLPDDSVLVAGGVMKAFPGCRRAGSPLPIPRGRRFPVQCRSSRTSPQTVTAIRHGASTASSNSIA
jgi:hypothetical protein